MSEGMPRRKGELAPREVAKATGTHTNTIYRWVRAAFERRRSPLQGHVRRDVSGRIWIRRDAIEDEPFYF